MGIRWQVGLLVAPVLVGSMGGCSSTSDDALSSPPPAPVIPSRGSVEPPPPPAAQIGNGCREDAECAGLSGGVCLGKAQGQGPFGFCSASCDETRGCPENFGCFREGPSGAFCLPSCATDADCKDGRVCADTGACVARCPAHACPEGSSCDAKQGKCIADRESRPVGGPVPLCTDLPPRDCSGSDSECGELVPFEPTKGAGYVKVPLNGETSKNLYRSYARRDLAMLIKHAAAYVECTGRAFIDSNRKPLVPGDMSEKDGAIPGTSIGSPGHPKGSHRNGFDADIGYYQVRMPDNRLRPVCTHETEEGEDENHCLGNPETLDRWRTALFLAEFVTSPRVRVIGVDGKVGPILDTLVPKLCQQGFVTKEACTQWERGLVTYETEDEGRGWYLFHHHHFHVSLSSPRKAPPGAAPPSSLGPWWEGSAKVSKPTLWVLSPEAAL